MRHRCLTRSIRPWARRRSRPRRSARPSSGAVTRRGKKRCIRFEGILMPYFVFDTETTGLCDFNRPAHAEGQPRLASWAMMFVDDDLHVTEGWHGLVKPDGWTMPSEATAINGLTDERLRAEGRSVRLPLFLIGLAIEQQYTLVAHNLQYDAKVMRGELRRVGGSEGHHFQPASGGCTPERLTNACGNT